MSTACLLFVDDEPNILNSFRRHFRSHAGWKSFFATSAALALETMSEHPMSVVITDVMMPGMDGVAFLRQIRQRYPDVIVIMITGLPSVEAAIECIKCGAHDYLSKPFSMEGLEQSIRDALAVSDEMAETQPIGGTRTESFETVDNYRIVRTIGEGAMGIVFEVTGAPHGDRLAMKMMKTSFLGLDDQEEARERFIREARTISALQSPYIAKVCGFGIGTKSQLPYIVMEFIDGMSVREIIDAGNWDIKKKLNILRCVAVALAKVHSHGLLHRDVKPDNIIVADDIAKLIDFGIVRIPRSDLTQSGTLVGTPSYLSPEMITGYYCVDGRSDLFSLGVVAYELFTGQAPFCAPDLITLARQISNLTPMSPTELAGVPASTSEMVMKLLEKNPDNRYLKATHVAKECERLIAEGIS